ncbi:MAG: hypothetical protein ABIL25_06720 [candidate division WOR-3 bacterium]
MHVSTLKELKDAVKQQVDEITVSDPVLAYRVKAWNTVRTVANILVFIILGLALFAWADPLHWTFLKTDAARLVRQIMLGLGLVLLFLEYVIPVVRLYKPVSQGAGVLKLVPRRRK